MARFVPRFRQLDLPRLHRLPEPARLLPISGCFDDPLIVSGSLWRDGATLSGDAMGLEAPDDGRAQEGCSRDQIGRCIVCCASLYICAEVNVHGWECWRRREELPKSCSMYVAFEL